MQPTDTSKISGPKSKAAHGSRAAFSLVEVTLALGVVAFAFISVFGLLPTGLNTFRQAIDASVESQIAQKVLNDVQQTDSTTLIQSGSGTTNAFRYNWAPGGATQSLVRYFDDQGGEVVPAAPPTLSAAEQQKVLYWVNTRVTPATVMPSGTNTVNYTNLATVTIQVVNNPGNVPLAADTTTQLWTNTVFPVSTYSAFVAQNINQ